MNMAVTCGMWNCLLVHMAIMLGMAAGVEYLYYTAPGGAPYGQIAGLYGAQADWRLNGSALDYPDSGYQCVQNKADMVEGLPMRSVSVDPKTSKVLLNVFHEDRRLSLLTADLCQVQPECNENATLSPDWVFNNAVLEHKAGPFAYYNNKIYFIWLFEEDEGAGRQQTIELRVFDGCDDKYPVDDWTAFYVADCSKKLATLEVIKFDIVSPLKVSDSLFITNSGGSLHFLVLLRRGIYDDHAMAVGHRMELVTVKETTKKVTTLHIEQLDIKFLRYATFHLGAIAMKNMKLCWSSVDRILCSDWVSSGGIKNVDTILPQGMAAQACLNTGHELTAEITTGIAIAHTQREFAIFFGCIAQRAGYGGAGLVRKLGDHVSVFPLLVNDTQILAGNMFLVSYCQPPHPNDDTSGGGYRYVFSSGPTAGSATLLAVLTLSLLFLLQSLHLAL